MNNYLVYDGINGDHETFSNGDEAREYLTDLIFSDGEYHPDLESCAIYKLDTTVSYDVIAKKSDYTDEEWEEYGYNLDYDEIWQHKFTSNTE